MVKTDVAFMDGFDDVRDWPIFAEAADLYCRFAVIQETYRADCVDMYFDEQLWLSILGFAKKLDAAISIGISYEGTGETGLDQFLSEWEGIPKEDREPPPFIFAGKGEAEVSLIVETEYWTRVGGPTPYHDSYTYSFYSSSPVGDAIMKHLADANDGRWNLAASPIQGLPAAPKRRMRLR